MPGASPLPALADEIDILTEAVTAAAALALTFHGRAPKHWFKVNDSPVSEADIAVEKLLESRLRVARPSYGWLSEETADDGSRLVAPRTFVVDPIDGTRDFVAGGRNWTIPVAIVERGRPVAAVLIAPSRNEVFRAAAGGGATRNGSRLRVSPRTSLHGAKLAVSKRFLRMGTDVPADVVSQFYASLAYRLARVADGRLDGAAIKPDAQDWDLAAADLLVHEAGGRVSDLGGAMPRYDRGETGHPALVAATPALVGPLTRLLEEAIAEFQRGAGVSPQGDLPAHGARGEPQIRD